MGWNKSPVNDIKGVTTIREAFIENADEYGIEVAIYQFVTDIYKSPK